MTECSRDLVFRRLFGKESLEFVIGGLYSVVFTGHVGVKLMLERLSDHRLLQLPSYLAKSRRVGVLTQAGQ